MVKPFGKNTLIFYFVKRIFYKILLVPHNEQYMIKYFF
jgi:hypothetical protein